MSKILFIALAVVVLMSSQEVFVAPGTGINEPIYACLLALLLSPWIERQFK